MTLTLDIEHDDTTSTLRILAPDELGDADTPSLQSARIEQQLVRQPEETDTAEVVVYRDAWSDVETDLDRTNDRLVIREDGDPVFGGRLADFERDGVVVSVLIDGPKRDAIDAEPSGGNDLFNAQPDSGLVQNELLPRVPTVGAGTVETVDSAIAFSESHASPGKSITKLARDADAEVRYRTTESGFELDYVDRLGDYRPDETLSPASTTVLGEPRIREQITEDVTHVRVLGAGEGTAQVQAEAVADSFDPGDDRAVYRRRVDKDIQEESRANSLAETLVAEYDGSPDYLEVEAEVPPRVAPAVGDEFRVQLPAHGVDTTLRVTLAERVVDADGDRYRVELSNRRHTAALDGEQSALELDSLSEGNAGQIIRDSDSQGFDKVDEDEPQEWFFDYPDEVIGEFEATLRVESQPFRRPASAQGHSHDFSVPSHTHGVSISDTTSSSVSSQEPKSGLLSLPDTETTVTVAGGDFETFTLDSDIGSGGYPRILRLRVYATTGDAQRIKISAGETIYDTGLSEMPDDHVSISYPLYYDLDGESLTIRIDTTDNGGGDFRYAYNYDIIPEHDHVVGIFDSTTTSSGGDTSSTTDEETSLEPGIVTETTLTPSNVSVEIGGETVVSGLDHPIQETVDIRGVLSAGANQITASSDSLGELRTSLTFEAVKNVRDTQ